MPKEKKNSTAKLTTRRDFLVKGGKYTLVTATTMQVLFTSKRAMAQSGMVRFLVSPEDPVNNRQIFTGDIPARSPSGIWNGNSSPVTYRRYSINFEGNIAHLPPIIPVTVHWDGNGQFSQFFWDESGSTTGTHTFNIPKTGGTIGNGGSAYDTRTNNPATQSAILNSPNGTVTFTASGVQTLILAVTLPNAP